MLNLSSNDYLGLANDSGLLKAFWQTVKPEEIKFSSSSSRLLTGNFAAYDELEAVSYTHLYFTISVICDLCMIKPGRSI